MYSDEAAWKRAVAQSSVRLQWDPDHTPDGGALERRAIQLGLRGDVLTQYARAWIVDIEDISDFVAELRPMAQMGDHARLMTPREEVYPISDPGIATRIGVSDN